MRYYLVDQIREWQPGTMIRGIKNVAMSEDFLEFHFPGNPIMPGVLLLEALSQLAGWLEAAGSNFQQWFILDQVKRCGFYGFALPGDQVELELTLLESSTPDRRCYQGIGLVGKRKKIVAELEGLLVPLADLEDPEAFRRLFNYLTRTQGM
jgi:3-hydroxyacyl-[acyl-carrier-protein] dehydratase